MTSYDETLDKLRRANPISMDALPLMEESVGEQILRSIVAETGRHGARRSHVRIGLAVTLASAVAVIAAAVTLTVSHSGGHALVHGGPLLEPAPTLAQPLGSAATQVSLADAAGKLGGSVVLPSSSLVSPSDLGSVWVQQDGGAGGDTNVAVTFPSAGLIVQYERPVPYPEPPAAMYAAEAAQFPDSMSVTDVNGVPALATRQDSDQYGTNFGAIEFVVGGTRIAVLGHDDEATLKSVALSIINRAGS